MLQEQPNYLPDSATIFTEALPKVLHMTHDACPGLCGRIVFMVVDKRKSARDVELWTVDLRNRRVIKGTAWPALSVKLSIEALASAVAGEHDLDTPGVCTLMGDIAPLHDLTTLMHMAQMS